MVILPKLVCILCNTIKMPTTFLTESKQERFYLEKRQTQRANTEYPLSHAEYPVIWSIVGLHLKSKTKYSESGEGINEERKGAGERKPETT